MSDAWYQPLFAGKNQLAIVYRGTTYHCVISASDASDSTSDDSDDIIVEPASNENPVDSGNTGNDNTSEDDGIVIER